MQLKALVTCVYGAIPKVLGKTISGNKSKEMTSKHLHIQSQR